MSLMAVIAPAPRVRMPGVTSRSVTEPAGLKKSKSGVNERVVDVAGLLTTRDHDDGSGCGAETMDVVLDTCWALVSEIERLSVEAPAPLSEFRQKHGEILGAIAKTRNVGGRYEIVERIGKGAFGNVYLVREEGGKYFAMKTISKSRVFRQPESACFMEERKIMSFSGVKWLVKLIEAFQDEKFLYVVMEYMAGGDLGSLDMEQKGLGEDWVKFYAAEIVLALEELHQLGYVHRDVKPGNVLLGEDGHVRLGDFGSAGRMDERGLVLATSSVGTPDYISPEALLAQQSRNGSKYGREADWWGLGVLVWELVAGEAPFWAPTLLQTYTNITRHRDSLDWDSLCCSEALKSLLKGLLCDASERLDCAAIKAHPFFAGIEWESMDGAEPPFVPVLTSPEDTSRFYLDEEDEHEHEDVDAPCPTDFGQFRFVGYTHSAGSVWSVARGPRPALRRAESCQIRLDELESQVAGLYESGETARLVGQQIRKLASREEVGQAVDVSTDELEAAHHALLQNYDFLQTHYEELLREHTDTARHLHALLTTLQEQEAVRLELQAELEAHQKRASLDKLKIGELVSKLASLHLAADRTDSDKTAKMLLKQKSSECRALQQQLCEEQDRRLALERELAKEKKERAVGREQREKAERRERTESMADGRCVRKSSDAGSLRRLFRLTTSPSTATMSASRMEGTVKILNPSGKKGRLSWTKTSLSIRDSAVQTDEDSTIASLSAEVFWVQPVQPGELVGLPASTAHACFKIRTGKMGIAADDSGGGGESIQLERAEVEEQLGREERMLRGAEQLLAAAKSDDQRAMAQAHLSASLQTISRLKATLHAITNGASPPSTHHHMLHTFIQTASEAVCDGCLQGGASYACSACQAHSHRECQGIVPVGCQEASVLASVQPTYIQAASPQEARRWIRSIDAARKQLTI